MLLLLCRISHGSGPKRVNLREMNSPSACGPRRAATIAESSEEVARCGYRYVSSIGTARRSIARVSLAIRSSSPRSHREAVFFTPIPIRPARPASSEFCTPGITCTRRKTTQEYRTTNSQRLIGRIVALAGLSLSLLPACPRLLERHHPPTTQATHHTHTPTNHALLSFFLFPRCPSHPEHPFSLYLHRPLASNSIASNSIEYSIRGILSQTSPDRECIDSRESSLSPPAHHIHAAIFTPRLRPQLPTPQPLTIPIIRVADLPKPGQFQPGPGLLPIILDGLTIRSRRTFAPLACHLAASPTSSLLVCSFYDTDVGDLGMERGLPPRTETDHTRLR